jgi:hypothetical protein
MTKTRAEIKAKILADLTQMVIDGIIIEDVLINKIVLQSIESKLQIEKEMERKRIYKIWRSMV